MIYASSNRELDITLDANSIQMWFLHSDVVSKLDVSDKYIGWLDEAERLRYDRFQLSRSKRHYLIGQSMLRNVLSCYENKEPAEWKFITNEYGKPALVEQVSGQELYFNLSHSNDAYVLVVARHENVGVDIEFSKRHRRIEKIAKRHFSSREFESLMALPKEDQLDRFYILWTLKEAYIKARGMGLAISLQQFGFEFNENAKSLTGFWESDSLEDSAGEWQFWQFEPVKYYPVSLAVAVESGSSVTKLEALNLESLDTAVELDLSVLQSC